MFASQRAFSYGAASIWINRFASISAVADTTTIMLLKFTYAAVVFAIVKFPSVSYGCIPPHFNCFNYLMSDMSAKNLFVLTDTLNKCLGLNRN